MTIAKAQEYHKMGVTVLQCGEWLCFKTYDIARDREVWRVFKITG